VTYVIGVDSSTTATKAVVWDRDGRAVSTGRQEFELVIPHPGWHEQDARDWWRTTAAALRKAAGGVNASEIEAIGVTHQRETFACLDKEGDPLRPAMLWLDARAVKEVEKYGSEEIHEITGKPPDTTPAFYKLLWLREHEPEVLERTARVVDVHAFLVKHLTGEWRTTSACADPLGLVDMKAFDWSDEVLGQVGLDREQLCELCPPGAVMGELRADIAEETGLPAGIPVVGGAGDGQSAGLGANITKPGRAYLNLGTAVVSGTYSDEYAWDRAFRTLGGPMPGTYTLETLLQGGTYTVSWFVNKLAGTEALRLGLDLSDEDVLEAAAARLRPGADGLLAIPYWNQAHAALGRLRPRHAHRIPRASRQSSHLPRDSRGHRVRAAVADRPGGVRAGPADRRLPRGRRRIAQPALVPDHRRCDAPDRHRLQGGRDDGTRRRHASCRCRRLV
jgi:xylulokinase